MSVPTFQGFRIDITEGVEFEFYLFKLETDLPSITVQNRTISIENVTILDWLYWAYFDDDVQIVNEDLVLDAEFEII